MRRDNNAHMYPQEGRLAGFDYQVLEDVRKCQGIALNGVFRFVEQTQTR